MANKKLKYKDLSECMKNSKGEKGKLNCKRIYGNIFDSVSKKQQSKQDSALYKGYDKDNIFYTEPKKNKK
jgi:hypothetical protein